MIPELIYCADGNQRFASIANEAGFTYGARMPATVYFSPEFIDQDWKKGRCKDHGELVAPDCELCALKRGDLKPVYMERLAEHRPTQATVLDWEWGTQLPEVLGWAEDAAAHVEVVIIIPKVVGGVDLLPRTVGGKKIHLGYSVATSYGATAVSPKECKGWPVHLLGGSPQEQKWLWLRSGMKVVSVDGNMHLKMATNHNAFFDPLRTTRRGYWPSLVDYDGRKWGDGSKGANAPYEAFARSCRNIWAYWHGHVDLLKRKNQLKMGFVQ